MTFCFMLKKRHILQNISSDIVLDGYTVIIFIGRVGWEDWGTNHLCKDNLPHGTAQVVLGLFLIPGFGTCGVLAVTPGPLPEVGNAQSVPIFPLPPQISFHSGWNDTHRKNSREGKCSVFSLFQIQQQVNNTFHGKKTPRFYN